MNLFAVTEEAITENKTGLVRVYGLTTCQVNVTNASFNQFCTPRAASPGVFKAGTFGQCLIKTIPAGTGTKWAVIDVHSERTAWVDGRLAGNMAIGGTATLNIYSGETATGETATGETATGETATGETATGETATGETCEIWGKNGNLQSGGLTSTGDKKAFGVYDFQLQKAILRGFRC